MQRKRVPRPPIRAHFVGIDSYSAVESPEALAQQSGLNPSNISKLNGNENPYGCSPKVIEALSHSSVHIYPDAKQQRLRKELGDYVGLGPEYLLAGAGSDELIDLLLRLFLDPGDEVVDSPPSFGMYNFLTKVSGGQVVQIPRSLGFEIDVDEIDKAISDSTKIIFLASPNNPTGNIVDEEIVKHLLTLGPIVVIDEAYYEFSGKSVLPLVPDYDNLVILRSLSKWAGLAGLRIGYGAMAADLVQQLMLIKQPYNINTAAEIAVYASLDDLHYLQANIDRIIQERESLFIRLSGIVGVTPFQSQANFILFRVHNDMAPIIYKSLAQKGIFLRYFDNPPLEDCLRVSIGLPKDSEILVKALQDMMV